LKKVLWWWSVDRAAESHGCWMADRWSKRLAGTQVPAFEQ